MPRAESAVVDGLPNPIEARRIVAANDERLLESLRYLCGVAARALGDSLERPHATLDRALAACRRGVRLRGAAYVLHNELVVAMKEQNVFQVQVLLDVAAKLRLNAAELDIRTLHGNERLDVPEDVLYLRTMKRENEQEYAKPFTVTRPSGSPPTIVRDVEEVLRRLRGVDPATAAEFDALVTDVVVMSSDVINGGTSFKAFGYLMLRERRFVPDWTNYLETLVHEAAHLYLYCLWSIDPIITDDGGRMYRSPLRAEPRPLSGIFHAMFVLARIIRSLHLFAQEPQYARDISAMNTAYNSARNAAPLAEKFEDAFGVVGENAQLTPLGTALLTGCRRMVDEAR